MAVIEALCFGYEQTDADAPTRLDLDVRYGQHEVRIPLNAVDVDGVSPYEEALASCQAAEDLASAMLLWSREMKESLRRQSDR